MIIEKQISEYQTICKELGELNKKYNELEDKKNKLDNELIKLNDKKEKLKIKLLIINDEVKEKLNKTKMNKNIEDITLFIGGLLVGGVGVCIGGQYGDIQGIMGFVAGSTVSTLVGLTTFKNIERKHENKVISSEEYQNLINDRGKTNIAIEELIKKINKLKEEWNENLIKQKNIKKEIISKKQEISNLCENYMNEIINERDNNKEELSKDNISVKRMVLSFNNKEEDINGNNIRH